MIFRSIVVAVAVLFAGLGVIAADPAFARAKHKAASRCMDRPLERSWINLFSSRPEPRPNGCSPPVYQYGRFIGQDPDSNIRLQLRRDPATGYAPL